MKLARTNFTIMIAMAIVITAATAAHAQAKPPNIVIIWGDDIGAQISALILKA